MSTTTWITCSTRGGLPKPFSRRPRLTVYRRELYDYAECINLAVLLKGRFPKLDSHLSTVLNDILNVWQNRTVRLEVAACCSGGTARQCTVGRNRSFSEVFACCYLETGRILTRSPTSEVLTTE